MTQQKQRNEDGTALLNGTAVRSDNTKTGRREKDSQPPSSRHSSPRILRSATSAERSSHRATSVRGLRSYCGVAYGVQFYGTPGFVASDDYARYLQRIRNQKQHSLNGNIKPTFSRYIARQIFNNRFFSTGLPAIEAPLLSHFDTFFDNTDHHFNDVGQGFTHTLTQIVQPQGLPNEAPGGTNAHTREELYHARIYLGAGCTYWNPPKIVSRPQKGRDQWLADAWNAFMHATNGNRDPPGKAKKASARKKKTPEQRAATKEKRKGQLAKQVTFLRKAQAEGVTIDEAKSLGRVIRGRGDYSFGENIGSKIGGFLGGKLHEWVKKITGFGDYEIQGEPVQNSLMARDSVPSFRSKLDGGTRIQFEEYLGYISVNQNFTRVSFPLDPTSRATFPWSWQISKRFQQYILKGMVVVVKSNMSPLTTSGVIGTIFGSVRYNVDAPPPGSKSEVMNSQFCVSESANKNLVLAIECAPGQTIWPLKVRQSGTTTGEEQLYQLGTLDICSQGAQGDYPNGAEVYAIYDLELLKPRIGSGAPVDVFMADLVSGNNFNPLAMIPSTPLVPQPRVNSLGLITTASGVVTFPYDTPPGSVFKATCAFNIGTPNGGNINTGSHIYTSAVNFYNNQSSPIVTPASGIGGPWVGYSLVSVIVIKILPGATFGNPPSYKYAVTNTLPISGGLLFIEETDPRACSGLTSLPPRSVSRNAFLSDLKHLKDRGVYRGAPLDLEKLRLVDYVEAFRRAFQVDVNSVDKTSELHEITLDHAIERLSIYESTAALAGTVEEKKGEECTWETLSINGAKGEYTGTDDVKDRSGRVLGQAEIDSLAKEVIPELLIICNDRSIAHGSGQKVGVNPLGATGPIELITIVARDRDAKGWSDPASAIIPLGHNMFLWPAYPSLLSRKLLKQQPNGHWTIDKLRRVQCRSMCGTACIHSIMSCPGYASLLKDMIFADDKDDDCVDTDEGSDACLTLNGNQGEATNSDDVDPQPLLKDPWAECFAGTACDEASHYHRDQNGKGTPKTAAARRLLEKQIKDGLVKRKPRKYMLCRLTAKNCKIPGPHYHFMPDPDHLTEAPDNWINGDPVTESDWPAVGLYVKPGEAKSVGRPWSDVAQTSSSSPLDLEVARALSHPGTRLPTPSPVEPFSLLTTPTARSSRTIPPPQPHIRLQVQPTNARGVPPQGRDQACTEEKKTTTVHNVQDVPPRGRDSTGEGNLRRRNYVGGPTYNIRARTPSPSASYRNVRACHSQGVDDGKGEGETPWQRELRLEQETIALGPYDRLPGEQVDLWPWLFDGHNPGESISEPVPNRPEPQPHERAPRRLPGPGLNPFDAVVEPGDVLPALAPEFRPAVGRGCRAERVQEVLLHYTADALLNLSTRKRIGRYLLSKLPFVKHTKESLTNVATQVDVEEVLELKSSKRDAFTFVPFWSQATRRKPFKTYEGDEVSLELAALGFKSCARAMVFSELLEYLRSWREETRDLQVRRAATSVEGKLEMIASFRDAVMRAIERFPATERLSRNSVITFYNTITYYIQQRLVIESKLSLGEAQTIRPAFRLTARQ